MPSALIGRTEERRRVTAAAVGSASSGSARCVEFVGEAGVGKTTLLAQLDADASALGARVLHGGVSEPEAELSWAGLATIVGSVLDELTDLPESVSGPLRSALGRSPGGATDAGSVAFALSNLLRSLAEAQPLVVIVDDVQWLDRPTAAALTFALRVQAPVLFVLARRDGPTPIDAARAVGADKVERIVLGGLSVGAVQMIVERVAGRHPGRRDLVRLHELTRGNPLFVERIARMLADGSGLDDLEVPPDLEVALGAQLGDLTDATLEYLGAVALAGRASVELLLAVCGAHLDEATAAARSRHLVTERNGLVEIAHPLLRQAVVGQLGELERRRLHRALAEHVTDVEQRAWHIAEGAVGADEEVAAALEVAAEHAVARGAPEWAVELLRRAIDVSPAAQTATRWERTSTAGRYAVQAGMWRQAIELLTEAYDTAPSPAVARSVARPLVVATHRVSAVSETLALVDSLIADIGDGGAFTSGMLRVAAHVSMFEDLRGAQSRAEGALHIAEHAQDPLQAVFSRCIRLQVDYLAGSSTDLDAFLAEIDKVEDDDDREFLQDATVDMFRHESRFDLTLARATQMLDRARRTGDVTLLVNSLSALASAETQAGRFRAAAEHLDELYELCVLLDSNIDLADALGQLCYVRAVLGDDIAKQLGEIDTLRTGASSMMAFQMDAYVGAALLVRGDALGAERRLDTAASVARVWGHDDLRALPIAHDLVEARIRLGQIDRAERVARWAAETAARHGGHQPLALAAKCAGLVAAARGERDEAVDHFRRAIEHHQLAGTSFELARTRLELGIALRGLKRRREARAELQAALELFAEIGAVPFETRAHDELGRLGTSLRPEAGSDPLTVTERQVAAAAVGGATNAEIASALHISLRTVESNLTRVYRKLGVRSRTELAAHPQMRGR